MSLKLLYPVANDATDDAWTLGAGATKHAACRSADGDTSYVKMTAGNLAQCFQVDTLPSGTVSGSLTVVNITKLIFTSGAATHFNRIREGGSTSEVDTGAVVQGAYGTEAAAFANPIGGGAWDVAKVNSHRYGMRASISSGTMEFRCSQSYAQIEQAIVAGGFVMAILEWLGPLVAVSLHELPALRLELWRASGRRLWMHRHEFERAWQELHEARHPRHFPMPVGCCI